MRHFILPCPVAARPLRMFIPATTGSPGSAAPLHAVTGDAHEARSQRNRYGPDRNRRR